MKSNAMWGGRFKNSPDEIMEKINASIDYDKKLYKQDIAGSKAHCNMLVVQSIISQKEGDKIIAGLDQVEKEIESGEFVFSAALEDIHMNIESRLTEIIGDVGGKLHTARSRNDQVATDFKLWVRDNLDALDEAISELQKELLVKAEEHVATFMPGYTHLQTAQPVTFGHHLLAYFEMLKRDRSRVVDARKRLNECPLGSAALAGTSFPLDRDMTAELLGFDRPTANSLDAVSDRDFALEYLNVASICAVHLSRLAEELVLWSSSEFNFIKMSDSFTSGSSIMPQKRNPDAAELVRAKVGRITGNNVALLIVMKGLPLAYSKDMQEDKEPVFDTAESIMLCVNAMTGMIKDLQINKENMASSAGAGFSTATDIADWLVKNLGIPFRHCHHITGEIVQLAEEKNCNLDEMELKDLQKIEPRITDGIYGVLSVENSVNSRTSFGGTAINNVSESIKKAVY